VHDEIAVRVGHRLADLDEQVQPAAEIASVFVAPLGDGAPLDEFHRHVRSSVRGNAAIDQPRDAR